ncbi:MAG TPA: amidophosphoribosyltransferase [Candidatus Anaerotruncus excrementipullorum]|uniref:Amidophosphoribosyltransferase n=1 Tax=Candidatus Anaerotruncus excrementipullorum TaxID=2838465 RepID=A0A9D1WQD0_9FIRM|nr:amidophosphoribosyltransferase [Candidatus Anaerotruncus excrementipullorum]
MFDTIHEECGVFGIYTRERSDVASSTYFALYALQHRGQESCGIAVNDRGVITCRKDVGLVPEVFHKDTLTQLGQGTMAIGHCRYSTTGSSSPINAQPLVVRHCKGPLALAHNGNLVNAQELRQQLELNGAIFHTTNDSEVISYIITRERLLSPSIEEAVAKAMYTIKGAYSLVIMSPQKLMAVRDPHGFRPLCIGRLPDDGGYVFASESCALDTLGVEFVRDVEPGEIVIADENGLRSIRTHCGGPSSICVFEYVYFARPDSVIEGVSVHEARQRAGRLLYRENPQEADVVIGVPDSGLDAALGYAKESGIPYGVGFIKNRYIGRTFIQPTQGQREDAVRIKLNVIKETVQGKRVVMVDDSIVRGTTCARIVRLLREAGAKEVHFAVTCPPFINPCYFGTDIDSREHLIACRMSIPEIAKQIDVDSLTYLSVEGVRSIAKGAHCGFCTGCFTGEYPVEVPDEMPKSKFEHKIEKKPR